MRARTGWPSISISSSEPMTAKGRSAYMEIKIQYLSKSNIKTPYPEFAVVLNGFFVVFFDIVWEIIDGNIVVFNILHDLTKSSTPRINPRKIQPTLFLKPLSSLGVKESAFPMTGMTLTRGERRRISSISISLKLKTKISKLESTTCRKHTSDRWVG